MPREASHDHEGYSLSSLGRESTAWEICGRNISHTVCVCRTKEPVGQPTGYTLGQQQSASPELPLSPRAPGAILPLALCAPASSAHCSIPNRAPQSHYQGHSLLSLHVGDSSGGRFSSPKRIALFRKCRGESALWNTKQTQLSPDRRGNRGPFCN